jgi:hypothetical protein
MMLLIASAIRLSPFRTQTPIVTLVTRFHSLPDSVNSL